MYVIYFWILYFKKNINFIFLRLYLLNRERESESERETAQEGGTAEGEGEAGSPLSRELDVDSIPGPQNYDLS